MTLYTRLDCYELLSKKSAQAVAVTVAPLYRVAVNYLLKHFPDPSWWNHMRSFVAGLDDVLRIFPVI
jgi:hypothetical protein